MSDEPNNDGADGLPTQTAQELLAAERENLLNDCGVALELEAWGNNPLTVAFGEKIETQLAQEEADIHDLLDSSEKPVSAAQQLVYRGRRSALEGVLRQVKSAREATLDALEKARKFEAREAEESGIHYQPPAWTDYIQEARKRTGRDQPAAGDAPAGSAEGGTEGEAKPERKRRRKAEPAPAGAGVE